MVQKKYEIALRKYLEAIKKEPRNPNNYYRVGLLFEKMYYYDKAIDAYKDAIRINPNFAKAINNIGIVLYKQKEYDKSAAIFQIALDTDPNYDQVYSNMGAALNKAKRYKESIHVLQIAIEKMPNNCGAYTNLGNVYNKIDQYEKAVVYHEKSIQIEPNGVNAYSNIATSFKNMGLTAKAIKNYKKAIELQYDFENAHFDLATVYLSLGDFANGLREYEWRLKKEEMVSHIYKQRDIFSKPMMRKGQDIRGKILLIHHEQGFGDNIMFARFLPQIKALGCTLIVACRDELTTLFKSMACIDFVINRDDSRRVKFNIHLPLMSLGYVLDVKNFEDFPTSPYFFAKKNTLITTQNEIIKVGICWSASSSGESYEGKVFDLVYFEPLIKNPKVQLYSLQVGYGSEQIQKYGYENDIIDFTEHFHDFSQTASFMKELDLVISSDTSVTHLAGALGVKTYTLLQKYPDWRWLNTGENSYLYPSMKLFRQKENKKWEAVFQSLFATMKNEYKLTI